MQGNPRAYDVEPSFRQMDRGGAIRSVDPSRTRQAGASPLVDHVVEPGELFPRKRPVGGVGGRKVRVEARDLNPLKCIEASTEPHDVGRFQADAPEAGVDLNVDRDLSDRKSTRLNSSHSQQSRMPSSA